MFRPNGAKKIRHATMSVGGTVLMGSDAPVHRQQKPRGFSVSLQTTAPEEADRALKALSKGGSVRMPIPEPFFAEAVRHAGGSVRYSMDD
jgi:PhnB protein